MASGETPPEPSSEAPASGPGGPAESGAGEGAAPPPARPSRPTPVGEGGEPAPAGETPARSAPTGEGTEGAPPRPARPARPTPAGEGARPARPAPTGEGAPARPAPARPAARAAQPTEPPPPDPAALAHPISKALAPLAPDLAPRFVHGYLELTLPADRLLEAARLLRDQFDYDYLSQVTAVDWPDRFEVVYTLYHLRNWRAHAEAEPEGPRGLMLRVNLPRVEEPRIISLVSVWPGAEFQEREVYDMMGIRFIGHPDLRRILLDDDFPGFPLRKDFALDPEYVLVRHLARGVEQQLDRIDAGDRPV